MSSDVKLPSSTIISASNRKQFDSVVKSDDNDKSSPIFSANTHRRRSRNQLSSKAKMKLKTKSSNVSNQASALKVEKHPSPKSLTNQDEMELEEELKYFDPDPSVHICPWSLYEPLEACDIQGNWYPAKIVDIKHFRVKIHFLKWAKRYDQWFDMDTDLIRPRNDPNLKDSPHPSEITVHEFVMNEEVLARWTDHKLYPARIKAFSKGSYCHVLFYDGYKKKVKLETLQKMPDNYQGLQIPPPLPSSSSAYVPESIVTKTNVASSKLKNSSKPILDQPIDPFKHHAFICDACEKGFRKESLLLQHKKHYHKIDLDLDDVPSLVPPQLRVSKMSRQHKDSTASGTTDSSGIIANDSAKQKVAKSGSDSNEDNTESSADQSSSSCGKKRKNENQASGLTSEDKKLKLENPATVSAETPLSNIAKTPDTVASTEQPLNSSMVTQTTSNNSAMKPLTVVIPNKRCKPNNILLFRDARQVAKDHQNDNIEEYVKCICPLQEESGLMVQCELCLSWQHGSCAGFQTENDVPPHGYFCQFCRQPQKSVRSQKNSYQLNHLLKNAENPKFTGSMFESAVSRPLTENNSSYSQGGNHEIDERDLFHKPSPSYEVFRKKFNNNSPWNLYTSAEENDPHLTPPRSAEDQRLNRGSLMFNNEHHHNSIGEAKQSFDAKHESDFFGKYANIDIEGDEEEEEKEELALIIALNQLSAALYDCKVNLHSLNYKIQNHRDVSSQHIHETQGILQENFELINKAVEKIEKEVELKDSTATYTSSSTLSAQSPEHFGISSDLPFPQMSISSQSTPPPSQSISGAIVSPQPLKPSLAQNIASNIGGDGDGLLFANPTLSDHQALIMVENMNNNNHEKLHLRPTLSSLSAAANVDASDEQDKSLVGTLNNSSNCVDHSPRTSRTPIHQSLDQTPPPPLFKLLVTSTDEPTDAITEHRVRPSMQHNFLPLNLGDGELKLELKYHFKDLQVAQEIVLLCAK